jgi:hypothetical protein
MTSRKELFVEKVKKYNKTPNYCIFCKKELNYEQRRNKYCSSSCSAKATNPLKKGQKRIFSEQALRNIRESRNKRLGKCEGEKKKWIPKHTNILFINCNICNKLFCTKKNGPRKTCSHDCRFIANFKYGGGLSGKVKCIRYYNRWMKKEIILQSGWELEIAKLLDDKNIVWERPHYIRWKDSKEKEHLYYPDFYLNDYNIYLDPKNPWCMKLHEEKMNYVSKQVKIEYGDIKKIINFLLKLDN